MCYERGVYIYIYIYVFETLGSLKCTKSCLTDEICVLFDIRNVMFCLRNMYVCKTLGSLICAKSCFILRIIYVCATLGSLTYAKLWFVCEICMFVKHYDLWHAPSHVLLTRYVSLRNIRIFGMHKMLCLRNMYVCKSLGLGTRRTSQFRSCLAPGTH